MRKEITLLLLVIALLVACGGKTTNTPVLTSMGSDSEPVSISFAVPAWELSWGNLDRLIKEFEAQNPDVHVELKSFSKILDLPPMEFDLTEDFWFKIASAADVFQVIFLDGIDRQTVRDGLVHDLKPFTDADSTFRADDFYPGALEAAAWDGGIWAMPTALDYGVILFDKEAFDAAGVAYPKIGWTWDDFSAKARALTVRSGDQVTRWGFAQDVFVPARLVEVRTGSLLDDSTTPPTPRFTEAEVMKMVQWWIDLVLKDQVMTFDLFYETTGSGETDIAEGSTLTEQGATAMWSGEASSWRWDSRGVVPYPVDVPDSRTTPMYFAQVAMSVGTAHPEAAWRWIDFLSRQPPKNSGWVPARRSVAEEIGFWEDLDAELAPTLRFAMGHYTWFSLRNWNIAYEAFDTELRAAFKGDKSVEDALEAAQAQAMAGLEAEAAQRAAATPSPVVVATAELRPAEGAVTITFIPMGSTLGLEPFHDAARQFHAAHPDLAVEIKNPSFTASSMADLAEQADCFQYVPYLDNPETLTAILSLGPLLEAEPAFDLDDFLPLLLAQYRRDGKIWGLPAEAQPYVIEYNQDLFDAAGREYPRADWTLDDFLALAQNLTRGEGENKQYGFVGTYEMLDLLMFVERLGGKVMDDAQDPMAATFDDPATVEAVKWYADLYLLHDTRPIFVTEEEREALINNGRAAMWAGPFGQHDRLRSGVLPFPQGPSDSGTPILNAMGYFISAKTTAAQACWEWIKFLTTEVSVVEGLPARHSIATSEAYCQQVGDEWATVYLTSVESSQRPSIFQRIAGQEWLGAYLIWLEQGYRQIVEEGMSPAQALAAAQEKADDYHACIVANKSLSGYQGYRACMGQVDPAYSVPPRENP